ncbi:Coenzyme F420 hydrogenase/dehydrogenase, beta subunit C-terminal domain [Bacteroides cellulosilyticus]|nr:Coenzyme F420 hydrogenase/dehydrogenase, beta subunit C-terminal domain [Bacteroides cellulosilyticus]
MYLVSGNKSECCGCTACQQVCKEQAIAMQVDNEGFLYPVKDIDKCTNCDLCERVCAFVQPTYNHEQPNVYAAYIKDQKERQKSSSGALFYTIAKFVINSGGVVFGAALNKKLSVIHQSAQTIEELTPLRGSKYVQSSLGDTFNIIRSLLKSGRLVYFTGTPCQVAGLKAFLRKEYSNLLTSDLVCHGVPSQKLFNLHLKYLEEQCNGKIIDYQFRDNKRWKGSEIITYIKKSQVFKRVLPTYDLSPYLYSFMYSFTYRYSCYHCPFAKIPRQGDITLADFWGVRKYYPHINVSKGVSLVLVNTGLGKQIWENVEKEVMSIKSDVISASKYNKNLVTASLMPAIRNGIYERIDNEGYVVIANSVFRTPFYWRIRIRIFIGSLLNDKVKQLMLNLLAKYKK